MPEAATQTDISISKTNAKYYKDPEYRQSVIAHAQEVLKTKYEENPDEVKAKWRVQHQKRMQSEEYRIQRQEYMRAYRKKRQEEVKQLKALAESVK